MNSNPSPNPYQPTSTSKGIAKSSSFRWAVLLAGIFLVLLSLAPGSLAVFLLNQEYFHWWSSNSRIYNFESNGTPVSIATLMYWTSGVAVGLFLAGCSLVLWYRAMAKRSAKRLARSD